MSEWDIKSHVRHITFPVPAHPLTKDSHNTGNLMPYSPLINSFEAKLHNLFAFQWIRKEPLLYSHSLSHRGNNSGQMLWGILQLLLSWCQIYFPDTHSVTYRVLFRILDIINNRKFKLHNFANPTIKVPNHLTVKFAPRWAVNVLTTPQWQCI